MHGIEVSIKLFPFLLLVFSLLNSGLFGGALYRKLLRDAERSPDLAAQLLMDKLKCRESLFLKIEIVTWAVVLLSLSFVFFDSFRSPKTAEGNLLEALPAYLALFFSALLSHFIFYKLVKPMLIRGVAIDPEAKIDFEF